MGPLGTRSTVLDRSRFADVFQPQQVGPGKATPADYLLSKPVGPHKARIGYGACVPGPDANRTRFSNFQRILPKPPNFR